MSRNENRVDTASKVFHVSVAYNDDTARVRIFTDAPFEGVVPVAEGKSKRRKGDRRDRDLGIALATGRAFEDLAARELAFAKSKLGEEEE